MEDERDINALMSMDNSPTDKEVYRYFAGSQAVRMIFFVAAVISRHSVHFAPFKEGDHVVDYA